MSDDPDNPPLTPDAIFKPWKEEFLRRARERNARRAVPVPEDVFERAMSEPSKHRIPTFEELGGTMNEPLPELSIVRLTRDLDGMEGRVPAGSEGTIVLIYTTPAGCEIELSDPFNLVSAPWDAVELVELPPEENLQFLERAGKDGDNGDVTDVTGMPEDEFLRLMRTYWKD